MKAPRFWSTAADRSERAGTDVLVAALLAPVGAVYGLAGRVRRALTTPVRLGIPVICVGNVTAGGAGKTPVCLALAERLQAAGRPVHILSRGYRGRTIGPHRLDPGRDTAREVGDEPLLLARRAPTWVARHRPAGGRAAEAAGASVLLMDDGLQNPTLAQDLCLMVVDGGAGFGNGRLIPAGPLREPLATALARVHAVILLGEDRFGVGTQIAASAARPCPVLKARLEPTPSAQRLAGERVVAFAGIGRPGKFFETCAALGAHLIATRAFPDHHRYRPEEIMALVERASVAGARLVTTEKDAVRLPPEAMAMVETLSVRVVFGDMAVLDALLEPLARADGGG